MRWVLYALSSSALVLGGFATEAFAQSSGVHTRNVRCTLDDDELTCRGTVAGLGRGQVIIDLTAETACINPAGKGPAGLASDTTGPVTPRAGRVDFSLTLEADCPPSMKAEFSDVTLTVIDRRTGETLLTERIF